MTTLVEGVWIYGSTFAGVSSQYVAMLSTCTWEYFVVVVVVQPQVKE